MVIFSLDTEFTPDELAAGRQEEREGVWWHDQYGSLGSLVGDGRPLNQFDTDRLIEHELMMACADISELERILPARHRKIRMPKINRYGMPEHDDDEEYLWGIAQRGGIHGDPLIRSIARRAFGERDVRWFEQPICACGHERDFHGVLPLAHRCLVCGTCTFSRERVDELYLPCACPGSWFMDPEQGTINKDRVGYHAAFVHRYLNGANRAIERARRTISGGPVRHAPSCGMWSGALTRS